MSKYCKNCRWLKTSRKVNYGELTALGGEIEIPNCYVEKYIEEIDDCVCSNYKRKFWKFWVK